MNANLNDREKQVCIAALHEFLQIKAGTARIDYHIPPYDKKLNEFDILNNPHTRAYCITAMQKLGITIK